MSIEGMNHFNVLTDDVEKTRRFYVDIVGLTEGDRPPLGFDHQVASARRIGLSSVTCQPVP